MSATQASFGNMLSSGVNNFKTALENFKPRIGNCLMISVPFVVLFALSFVLLGGAALIGVGQQASTQDQTAATLVMTMLLVLLLLAVTVVGVYTSFCFLRFTSRASANPSQQFSFGSLLAYESSVWGFIGLILLQSIAGSLAGFFGGLLSIVLFFLLGLPYILVSVAYMCFFFCSTFAYFDDTQAGVFAALSRGWSLVTKDWRRWAAMALLTCGAAVALFVAGLVLGFTVGLIPVVGPLAVTVAMSLAIYCYFPFVMCSCYRDSAASCK